MTRMTVDMTSRARAVQQVCSRNSFIVIRSHSTARSAFHGASRGTYARTRDTCNSAGLPRMHAESLCSVALRDSDFASPNFRLRLHGVMCDILVVRFRVNGERNLNSSNKRCTTVYSSVLSSMYIQGVRLRTRSRSRPENEDSDSTPMNCLLNEPGIERVQACTR